MKKLAIVLLPLALILGLVGCSGREENTQTNEATSAVEFDESTMPKETQLMMGTLKLDGTDLEVTANQASELLILWKAYQSLVTSDTSAQEEIDAVISQIQETMTPEQLDAIEAMTLTPGDMASIMEDLGLDMGTGSSGGNGGRFQGFATPEGGFPQGEVPEGGFPGGGFLGGERQGGEGPVMGGPDGQGFGEGLTPDQIATLQAERGDQGNFRNRTSLFLLNPLIQYLEGKVE
jgi:hypothetical protein